MAKKIELTSEEIKEAVKSQGKKLGFLIAALNISDIEKEAWLTLLPNMSLEQIERLGNILESKYTDQQTKGIDEELRSDLEKIKTEYDKKVGGLNTKTIKKIKDLSSQVS
ncbi:hypothetical protein MYX07_06540 [Patescibacteria group bacterium AH-259-L07]|nr:hypothetical protein [Patescibacteria group bacterium AH-259-L07]